MNYFVIVWLGLTCNKNVQQNKVWQINGITWKKCYYKLKYIKVNKK